MAKCARCETPAQHVCPVCGSAVCVDHSALRVVCDRERAPKRRPRVRVRRATAADRRFYERIEDVAVWEHLRPEKYRPDRGPRGAAGGPRAENLVAEVDGKIVGTAEYRAGVDPHEAPAVMVTDLAVLPEFQGMGVGGALVRELKAVAKRRGFERVYVSTTVDNVPAMVFHLKHGAKVFHVSESDWGGKGRWGIPTRFDIAFLYEIP